MKKGVRTKWRDFKVCANIIKAQSRVGHIGTFLLFCLGTAQMFDPSSEMNTDFLRRFLEPVNLASRGPIRFH